MKAMQTHWSRLFSLLLSVTGFWWMIGVSSHRQPNTESLKKWDDAGFAVERVSVYLHESFADLCAGAVGNTVDAIRLFLVRQGGNNVIIVSVSWCISDWVKWTVSTSFCYDKTTRHSWLCFCFVFLKSFKRSFIFQWLKCGLSSSLQKNPSKKVLGSVVFLGETHWFWYRAFTPTRSILNTDSYSEAIRRGLGVCVW